MNEKPRVSIRSDGSNQQLDRPSRTTVRRDPTLPSALRPVRELAEGTTIGEVYLDSLLRSQRRLALRFASFVVALFGVLVVLFASLPSMRHRQLFSVPLGWFCFGLFVYPVMFAIARMYVRLAERNESGFLELVEESERVTEQ